MFDTLFRDADDAAVVAAIEQWSVTEAAAAAHRLAAIAELARRRTQQDEERRRWVCDGDDAAAAEISAALGIAHGRALSQMETARLLGRLPAVAALFVAGGIHARVIEAITWRTALVTAPEALTLIDADLAKYAGRWNALSQYKIEQAIDTLVDRHDPSAVRRTRTSARSREVTIGAANPEAGTAALYGRLFASDAALLDRRLSDMARAVCADDPRTLAQRRADALGALAAGAATLTCQCGDPDCPAAGPDPRATSVVVHVLADAEALTATSDPLMSGDERDGERHEGIAPPPRPPGHAVLVGGGMLPTPLLAALIESGAAIRYLRVPAGECESRYRPSTALDEFIRMRDLTCRFPGCDRPAERCDVDHRVPWPAGSTHPSALRIFCRLHHLLRTFWTEWTDVQHPDGTIEFTSPSGRTYATEPASRFHFPNWNTDTGPAPAATAPEPGAGRGLMMPTRRRTRRADRERRIRCERALNDTRARERGRPPPY